MLRPKSIAIAAAALFALESLLRFEAATSAHAAAREDAERASASAPHARVPDLAEVSALIVRGTNALRAAQALGPVVVSAELERAAHGFAHYMARTDQHGHEVDGSAPAQRAERQGYNFCMVSENIAYRFDSTGFETAELARKFVEGWEKSPGHRKNMLDPDALETGTAVARSARTGRYYAVQMFGRPRSATIAFEVANLSDRPVQYRLGARTLELPVRGIRTHEQCRGAELAVPGTRLDGQSSALPRKGDRFAIERDHHGLKLIKQ